MTWADAASATQEVVTMASEPTTLLQVTGCPACALPAEVGARHVLASTDGPVEHARVRCVGGHVFNLPVAMLEVATGARGAASDARRRSRSHPRS